MITETLAWTDPLDAATSASVHAKHLAFLYSGQRHPHSGRYSYLGLFPRETIEGSDFTALASRLTGNQTLFCAAWFGYIGYEMLHQVESLPQETRSYITLPDLRFNRFGALLVWDHDTRTLQCHRDADITLPADLLTTPPQPVLRPAICRLTSSHTRAAYLDAVKATTRAIAEGAFYQANITRKFMGEWERPPAAFSLFRQLCAASPATYSAYLQQGEEAILSSSPERFLTIGADGRMETRPIKGTAARAEDTQEDERLRDYLANSEKDRAENLMIVDLMRNDMARACETGSVKVDSLFNVTSYATLHHMASTVSGQKRHDVSTLEAVRRCFPPGSMTGAPKIRAMQWCMQQEKIRRGIYSGALGWFGGDGSCDLSVVIRTLIIQGHRFEFQVGGGIVADSTPEREWEETLTKARGIAAALGIPIAQLAAL